MFNIVRANLGKQNALEKVFDRLLSDVWDVSVPWTPAVDFSEDDKEYKLSLEIPGVKKEDLDIEIEGDTLKISGEKKKDQSGLRTERYYGSFSRSFLVPKTADKKNIKAIFENGVLTITLPKTPTSKPHRILIE